MDPSSKLINYMPSVGDACLVDCATTHTILRDKKYFSIFTLVQSNVHTISGPVDLIKGSGKATIILPKGTIFQIEDALYSNKSSRNLLSFKDIYRNGYHIATMKHDENEYLLITSIISEQKCILEQLPSLSCGLYQTTIRSIESYAIMNQKFNNSNAFLLWHERLGHPGISMMRRIVQNYNGHPLTSRQILVHDGYTCVAFSKGKFIIRPSFTKVTFESPAFLERIQGDICGLIHPLGGSFRYFMVLIDASTRWSHVCLLSSSNVAFARLLAQIIRLRTQFPDHLIKTIRLDNAGEISSQAFLDSCVVYVPITPTHRPKLGPQCRLGIYVGFQSASIINYIEPLTGEVFTARFADCYFNEKIFPAIRGR